MKLVYLLLSCALITMNSAFAAPKEEGPFGENNKFFCLKKKTVIEHLESVEPCKPYAMVQPLNPLIIKGCEYNIWGPIMGATGEDFKTDPTIQWVVFQNDAPSPSKPCEDWSYVLQPLVPELGDIVNLEIHKKYILDNTPVSSSN